MNIHFSFILSFIFLGFIIIVKRQIKQKEGMIENKKLILIGDSIFQNENYVEERESIEDLLQDKATVVAKDNAKILDVYDQLNFIPESENIETNVIVVSAGGNDLDYIYKDLGKDENIDIIFNNYKELIMEINKKTKTQIVLSTIYYPTSKDYKPYLPIVKEWNQLVIDFANINNFGIFHLDKYVTKSSHFTQQIEPSKEGGKIIADKLLEI
tara:strand:- start:1042 stop:1677 length:636 start_codon:yes stop_codon:yes gene_type:complete